MPFNSKYERKQIAVMGRSGVGKSSLIKALSIKNRNDSNGTPYTKSNETKQVMELLPFGPLYLIDTIGFDIKSEIGKKRINNTIKTISITDLVILVLDARESLSGKEWEILSYLAKISVPYVLAVNKIEYGVNPDLLSEIKLLNTTHFEISCTENVGIDSLKTKIMRMLPQQDNKPVISDIIVQGDVVVLVVPDDLDSLKSRQILPQIQTIKEALNEDTTVVVTKVKELRSTLYALKNPPDLVIADSNEITKISPEIADDKRLTTFSMLMTRRKGNLQIFIKGLKAIETLNDGDKILITEACAHHYQNYKMEREQITKWLKLQTNKNLDFIINTGIGLPEDLSDYKMIIHCSGCMLNRKIMQTRIKQAMLLDIPIVNYDIIISLMNGALPRILLPFEKAAIEWKKVN